MSEPKTKQQVWLVKLSVSGVRGAMDSESGLAVMCDHEARTLIGSNVRFGSKPDSSKVMNASAHFRGQSRSIPRAELALAPVPRVLLVEDDGSAANYVAKGLRENGYVVDHVSDGRSSLFQALDRSYSIIILDRAPRFRQK